MRRWWLVALLGLVALGPLDAQTRPAKKLIEYGWDVPTPDFVRANIRAMEQRPFDGLIFRLKEYNHAFDPRPWTAAQLKPQLDDLAGIAWTKFTDNFLCLYSANDQKMNWFDDAQWETIAANLRLSAEAARAGRCVGVCFDPEPYGDNPWVYSDQYRGRPFYQVEAQVRRRGAQFITALQGPMPDLKLLTFFQLSLFGHLFAEPNPEKRAAKLSGEGYALLPAFLNGMLDAAAPGVRIIDGNEPSYYYTRDLDYLRAYQMMRQKAQALVAPENRDRYTAQVQAGVALYVDHVLALTDRKVPAYYLSPEERLRYFEHNTYQALDSTDEYVWCYSEKMDWYHNRVPDGLDQAVASARAKLAAGKPLGFDLAPIMKHAEQARDAALAARLICRTAVVGQRGAAPAPSIDGRLDDELWRRTTPLEPFLPVAEAAKDTLSVATTASVVADDQALYVAFRCPEPQTAKLNIVGDRRDADVWQGDSVDLFLSTGATPKPYRHLIVNPKGVLWDAAADDDSEDTAWNSGAQAAAVIGNGEWTVELRIPWSDLGGAPKRGETRRANLCRNRHPVGELSAWSSTLRGFVEPDRFGTLQFR